ncbi:MAG: hypothetical protein HY453_00270 [Parcubacteria group bacterium]|nr:hypothetical protein [Parcubacteria group bacterium]
MEKLLIVLALISLTGCSTTQTPVTPIESSAPKIERFKKGSFITQASEVLTKNGMNSTAIAMMNIEQRASTVGEYLELLENFEMFFLKTGKLANAYGNEIFRTRNEAKKFGREYPAE